LSKEEALRRLVAGAGTQFDAAVVQAFLEWMESRGEEPHGVAEEAAAVRELPGEVV